MAEAQGPLRETLPEQLRAFLPPNIIVDVDDEGYIERITDRFEREHKTMGEKIRRMKLIVRKYNSIVKQVKKDLKSSDEITQMAALITAILMETGIRPGRAGNRIVKTVDGEEVEIETFGAITLGPAHVKFVRKSFAELDFLGKAGTTNTASLSDRQIIGVLQDYVNKAQTSGSEYIFVTSDGRRFTKSNLDGYFTKNFKGVSPTDFRKLRATDAVLQALRDRQEGLYEEIRGFVAEESENLKERVVESLVATVNAAVTEAAKALSHDSGPSVTQTSYINPDILLRFLSTGRAAENLKSAILDGRTQLAFDPMTFVEMASPKSLAASSRTATLRALLEDLEEELDTPLLELPEQQKLAVTFNVDVGQPIWYGKYKNKRGIITGFKTNEKGDTIIIVEQVPNPTGRKQPVELKLFKIRPREEAV